VKIILVVIVRDAVTALAATSLLVQEENLFLVYETFRFTKVGKDDAVHCVKKSSMCFYPKN